MSQKLHVVLDIDDTLLKHTKNNIWEMIPNKDQFEIVPSRSGRSKFVLRPHLEEFMKYLFENCEVSIWTWSDYDYAMEVSGFLTAKYGGRFKDILSEEDAEISATLHKVRGKDLNYLWYDYNAKYAPADKWAKRNAEIEATNEEREAAEEQRYNPNPKTLFSGYTPCNTVLIDDAEYNYVVPGTRRNMIKIKPFGGATESAENRGVAVPVLDPQDNTLLRVVELLKSLEICKEDEEKPIYTDAGPVVAGKRKARKTRKLRKVHRKRHLKSRRLGGRRQ